MCQSISMVFTVYMLGMYNFDTILFLTRAVNGSEQAAFEDRLLIFYSSANICSRFRAELGGTQVRPRKGVNGYGTFLQQLECGYGFPLLIHVWIASACMLELFISMSGEATMGCIQGSFVNLLLFANICSHFRAELETHR